MRPMLAAPAPEQLDFPHYASTKLDGLRCLIHEGVAKTRKLEVIPNLHVQRMLGHPLLEGLDGELCVGPPYADDLLSRTQSGIMSVHGTPDFVFYVFDHYNGDAVTAPYQVRYERLRHAMAQPVYAGHPNIQLLEQRWITSVDQLSDFQEDALERGYEGLILRNPAAGYKFGRSTDNPIGSVNAKTGKPLQPWTMLKVKKFSDGEARVTAVVEMMRNENDLEEDELGLAKRSSAQSGLVPAGVLGALEAVDLVTGVTFRIGSGFDAEQRARLWLQRAELIGQIVKYKHFEIGVKVAPRHPIFVCFRDARDVGDPA